jgi:hypothetical protein
VGEGALKIGRRRQQSRRFFVMVGVVEMESFFGASVGRLMARFLAFKKMAVGYNLN